MDECYEKMREQTDRIERSRKSSLSTRDVVTREYTDSELRQLVAGLSTRPLSVDTAFRLASFISERQQDRIPSELRRLAADAVADYVASSVERLDDSAVRIFIVWGAHRPDHRRACLTLLRHPGNFVRMVALSYARAYLKSADIPELFEFRNDPDISEIGMGGPLRYILRDHALEILERLTKCPSLNGGDCFDETREGRVSYRSWTPFLNWYERHKSQIKVA
jgi:hypothetical protein